MRYYVQTMPGVEEIAWLEIRALLPEAQFVEYQFAKEQNGIVLFDYDGSVEKLLQLQTAEDVFMEALSISKVFRGRRDLQELKELVGRGEAVGRAINALGRYRKFSTPPTFRVISRKYGKHEYRRKDMERVVLEALQLRNPRWTAVSDAAQVEFWVNLLGSRLLLGIRLSDKQMRHRFKRKVELPASLRPSVAAAMVFLTEPTAQDVFLDPMCGSGTILLARRLMGSYKQLLGGDSDPTRVAASEQNIAGRRKKGLPSTVQLRRWDAQKLPLETGSVDKVATNLPFGKQVGTPAELERLYPAVFKELERVVRPNGRLVILSSEYELVKTAVRQCPHLEIERGYSIAVLGQWGRIYLIRRTNGA